MASVAPQPGESKMARLEARIPAELKALVQRAAALQGQSLTDFILAAAAESAHRVLREREALLLSERDQVRLAQAVLSPQPPPPRLANAAARRR